MQKHIVRKGTVSAILLLLLGLSIFPSAVAFPPFTETSTGPIQLIINDDGSGNPTDKNVSIPPYVPDSGITPTLSINFTIRGLNTSEPTAFYGDDPGEDWKNISITGDILYPVNEMTLSHVGTNGDWNCTMTPTEPFGLITLSINWPGNGTANNSIQIVNGSFVTPHVNSFPWGTDFNLTVTVTDMDGDWDKFAYVYLIWEDDDYQFNSTIGDDTPGNGMKGEYTFWITKEDQGEIAPKNITLAARCVTGFWGYAKVAIIKPFSPPIIYGPFCGKINTEYSFLLGEITDPEADQFYCLWDWGDGNSSGWLGPFNSGTTISESHTWTQPGSYLIKVKLKDSVGVESNWSEPFTISITSRMLLIGILKSVANQSGECTIFNMSLAIIIKMNPIDLKIYSLVQILVLLDEFQGLMTSRLLAGRIYGLVLSLNPYPGFPTHPTL